MCAVAIWNYASSKLATRFASCNCWKALSLTLRSPTSTVQRGTLPPTERQTEMAEPNVTIPGESSVTNIAFGGDDMRWAYIPQSASGTIIRTRWSEPGLMLNYNPY